MGGQDDWSPRNRLGTDLHCSETDRKRWRDKQFAFEKWNWRKTLGETKEKATDFIGQKSLVWSGSLNEYVKSEKDWE